MELVVITRATGRAKLQLNRHHQKTNTQLLQAGCPSWCPTNNVKAQNGKITTTTTTTTTVTNTFTLVLQTQFSLAISGQTGSYKHLINRDLMSCWSGTFITNRRSFLPS